MLEALLSSLMICNFPLILKSKAPKSWYKSLCVCMVQVGFLVGLTVELLTVGSSSICYCLKILSLRSICFSRKKSSKALPGMEQRGISLATNILRS